MLTVTKQAVAVLKSAKASQGASPTAGVRIAQGTTADNSGKQTLAVAIRNDPAPDDQEFEKDGLRIFVQDSLVEPLDGRTLDVRDMGQGPELVLL